MDWKTAEAEGWVALKYEYEEDDIYDDSYIDTWGLSPEETAAARKELWEEIGQKGVWGIVGYVQGRPVDSVWGIIGRDEVYEESVKQQTLAALDALFTEMAAEMSQRATYAWVLQG